MARSSTSRRSARAAPPKAAQALIAAVESSDPPALLLLGRDALDTFRQIHEAQRAEVDAWQKLTASTDLED
jgi:hypothetical protein